VEVRQKWIVSGQCVPYVLLEEEIVFQAYLCEVMSIYEGPGFFPVSLSLLVIATFKLVCFPFWCQADTAKFSTLLKVLIMLIGSCSCG
jgi:hypothetical protein